MKVAAYQAPLLPSGAMDALELIHRQIERCEAEGVAILCCPEAVLGGLADDVSRPADFALHARDLAAAFAPLASETVATIVGFTEIDDAERLYNSAAVLHRGSVAGVYRKHHPAINRSVYHPGERAPIFAVGGFTFGILICNDSNFAEPARTLVAQGARALFVPTNNALPPAKADVVSKARAVDTTLAQTHAVAVIRADVAGRADGRVSYGSSWMVDAGGTVRQSATRLSEQLILADLTF